MSKPQSLAAKTPGVLAAPFTLPAVFQAPQEQVKARFIAPYITFAHMKRADEWNKIRAKNPRVEEGDMYLIRQDNVIALPEAKLGWICHKQYWAMANPAGEVQAVSFEERPNPYKEHIQAVVLVYLPDEVLPANVEFRTTKCGAAKTLADTLAEAATPAWGENSPQHKETLVLGQPFMRFFGKVSLGPTRSSKTSGLPYRPAVCSIEPTGVSEWRLLKALQESEGVAKAMEDAAQRFEYKIAELTKKVQK